MSEKPFVPSVAQATYGWRSIPNSGSVVAIAILKDGRILGVGVDSALYTRSDAAILSQASLDPKALGGWTPAPPKTECYFSATQLVSGEILGVGLDYGLWVRSTIDTPTRRIPSNGQIKSVTQLRDGTIVGVSMDNTLVTRASIESPWVSVPDSGNVTFVLELQNGMLVGIGPNKSLYSRTGLKGTWEAIPNSGYVISIAQLPDGTLLGVGPQNMLYVARFAQLNSAPTPAPSSQSVRTSPDQKARLSQLENSLAVLTDQVGRYATYQEKLNELARAGVTAERKAAEQDQKFAELDRKLSEVGRDNVAQERKLLEQDRKLAEQEKSNAEQERKFLEQDRKLAEQERRLAAEQDQKFAKLDKKLSEVGRDNVAQERKLLEQDRKLAEQEKRNAEQERKLLEQDRKLAEQDRKLAAQEESNAAQERKLLEQDRKLAEQDSRLAELCVKTAKYAAWAELPAAQAQSNDEQEQKLAELYEKTAKYAAWEEKLAAQEQKLAELYEKTAKYAAWEEKLATQSQTTDALSQRLDELVKKPEEKAAPIPQPGQPELPDDLEKIEGIGPKASEQLKSAGITTFMQLSNTDAAALQKILKAGGSKYTRNELAAWPKQAQLIVAGKTDELKALQDSLRAGRPKS